MELPSEGAGSGRRRVVLVEDSDDVRDSMRDLLEDWGHEVTEASTGQQGVDAILSLRPDVALVDVGLPGMDGYEVARRLRAAEDGRKLFLVALTGYGGPEVQSKASGAGFDLHLTKPIDVEELERIVRVSGPE